jgi:hypothetical protein
MSPILSESTPTGRTEEGGPGYARGLQSELFLLSVQNMVGQDTFYETAKDRDSRFATLTRNVAALNPQWTMAWIKWLRTEGFLRTAPMVAAAHALDGLKRYEGHEEFSGRLFLDAALQRPDEPGEALAYWRSTHPGKDTLPISWRRGAASAATRMYTQRAFLKYDTGEREFDFARVIALCRPRPRDAEQSALFSYILDRHYKHKDAVIPAELKMITANRKMQQWDLDKRRRLFTKDPVKAANKIASAGMTWETVSGWLQGEMTGPVWDALIPSMGFQALRMNLRNFDQAGISPASVKHVVARLSDPAEIVAARQWPMQLLSSARAVGSGGRWQGALERALQNSLDNITTLEGRTLILVDTSASMDATFSKDGTLARWDAAVLFGLALAHRCDQPTVVSFSNASTKFPFRKEESLLSGIARWKSAGYFLAGGTETTQAVARNFDKHDRVVILTDEQASDYWGKDPGSALPDSTPLYTYNLAGYRRGHAPSGAANRHVMSGLTDSAFRQIELLERGQNANWPFYSA